MLSCIVTHPLIFKFRSYIYGGGGDSLGAVWLFWWARYAHFNNFSFNFCPLISTPFGVDFGVNFSQSPFSIGAVFISRWLSLLTGEIFAYNLLVFISFPLAAIITYYLVFYFTKNRIASVISGLIYAFCPYHFTHAYQHLTLANIQWIPLFFLALFNLDERRTYGNANLAALAFALVFLSNYYYGYFVTIFTGIFILWRVWYGLRNKRLSGYPVIRLSDEQRSRAESREQRVESREQRAEGRGHRAERKALNSKLRAPSSKLHFFKVVLVAVLVALVIILPAIYPMLKNIFSPKTEAMASLGYERSFSGLFTYSAQLFHYLIPSGDNPFIRGLVRNFVKVYHPVEQTLYLGWVGIVLSFIAVRGWRRKNREQRAESRERRAERKTLRSELQSLSSKIQDLGARRESLSFSSLGL